MNAIRDENHIRVYKAYLFRESLRMIVGSFFDPDDKAWVIPFSRENVALLALFGAELDEALSPTIKTEVKVDEKPIFPMPIKATPYQHQISACNFALCTFGIGGST